MIEDIEAAKHIPKDSIMLRHDDQKISKLILNREDIFQSIFPEGIGRRGIESNVCALIRDLEKSVNLLKNFNRVAEYESTFNEK